MFSQGRCSFQTQNPYVFKRGVWFPPHSILVFSQGWCSSHHVESSCFPQGAVVASVTCHHTESLCFPKGCVAFTVQNPCVFPRGVWLSPHRIQAFSQGVWFAPYRIFKFSHGRFSFHHIKFWCFLEGAVVFTTQNRFFPRGVWLACTTQIPSVFLRGV